MTAIARNIPDEIFYHFAVKQQSVDELFNTLYDRPTEIAKQHFMAVNGHLKQQVRPGQMVIVTPPDARQCTAFEADLSEEARRIDRQLESQSEEEARIMAQYYDLLANAAGYSGVGYGVVANYFQQHKKQVEHILTQIEKLYVQQYNKQGRFNNSAFFQNRQRLFQQLDNVLKTMVGRARMGLNIERGDLKRSLGLSSKSIVYQLKEYPAPVDSIPGFEKNHRQVIKYSKVLKRAGYFGLALDGVQSAATIRKACTIGTEVECTRSKFSEGGRLTGSVAGGWGGGGIGAAAGYGLCNLIFGIETLGTSIIWCGIVAGGAGGYIGSSMLGNGGKAMGEVIYETTIK